VKEQEGKHDVTVREMLKGQNGTGSLRTSLLGACVLISVLSFLGGVVLDRIGIAETESGNRAHIVQMDGRLKNIESNMATRGELEMLSGQVTELQRTLNNLLLPSRRRATAEN